MTFLNFSCIFFNLFYFFNQFDIFDFAELLNKKCKNLFQKIRIKFCLLSKKNSGPKDGPGPCSAFRIYSEILKILYKKCLIFCGKKTFLNSLGVPWQRPRASPKFTCSLETCHVL